jgi:hypothetical protein
VSRRCLLLPVSSGRLPGGDASRRQDVCGEKVEAARRLKKQRPLRRSVYHMFEGIVGWQKKGFSLSTSL